jgi:peroxiredoxin
MKGRTARKHAWRRPARVIAGGGPAKQVLERKECATRSYEKVVKFLFDKRHGPFQSPLMVAVNSTMLPLGTKAPDFELPDTNGKMVSPADFKTASALLVIFMCNHCPYVKHIRAGLAQLARDYMSRGVAIVGISSNDVDNYPQDSPKKMAEEAKSAGYVFPYLYDETQEVAKAYRAACTPDIFLFDGEQRLTYRGQFDDSRPGNGVPVTGKDVRAALDALLSGKAVAPNQKASIGCNIKWKPGNEPEYFR